MVYPDYIEKLNPAQKQAAVHRDGPLLIIAGAGSGKTTVLIARLAYLVDNGVPPESILMLTFTNKAADNMVDRAAKMSNEACKRVTACTYHSFCAKVLRRYYHDAGIIEDFNIILDSEETDAVMLVKSQAGYQQLKKFPTAKHILECKSIMINRQLPYEEAAECVKGTEELLLYRSEVEDIFRRLEQYKHERGLLDYDDLLLLTDRLLEKEEIRTAIGRQYRYVMVDEYQDTNHLQESIVFRICADHHNLAVVGDDFQSVYRFRGADISNIIDFPKRVSSRFHEDTTKVVIATNYRSTAQILDVANEMMRKHAHFGYPKNMADCGKTGNKPKMVHISDGKEEAEHQYDAIMNWHNQGGAWSEIAVIERTAKESAVLEAMLTKEGVPFTKLGGLKFMEHACVVDMLNFLRIVSNPFDDLAWFHVLDLVPGVGGVYAHQILEDFGTDLFLSNPAHKRRAYWDRLQWLKGVVQVARTSSKNVPLPRVFTFLKDKYFELYGEKIRQIKVSDESKRTEYWEQFHADEDTVSVLEDMVSHYQTIPEFLDSIVLDSTPGQKSEDAVTITTVHSAKGLEWEFVLLSNVMDGVYPGVRDVEQEDVDESLRCLYVAITRAKKKLYLYVPKGVVVSGFQLVDVSPFVDSVMERNLVKGANTLPKAEKVYIRVPYSDKEYAKALGAKWDAVARCWWCMSDNMQLIHRYGVIPNGLDRIF